MVAYSFKAQFVLLIESGAKQQTIRKARAGRSRHARAGDQIQHMTGPRFRPRRFGVSVCTSVSPIVLTFSDRPERDSVVITAPPPRMALNGGGAMARVVTQLIIAAPSALDVFAQHDGFSDWEAMREFWQETHGVAGEFTWAGALICWEAFRAG